MDKADRIRSVESFVLRAPAELVRAQDDAPHLETLLVLIRTEAGLIGLGECNHHPTAAQAFLSAAGRFRTGRGVVAALIGRDPGERAAICEELYLGNFFSARRGIGWAVLAAIDTALWDLTAQQAAVPLWRMLWGEQVQEPAAYQTLYTGASPWPQTRERLAQMVAALAPLGFPWVKIEPLTDCVPEEHIGAFAADARALIGPEVGMLIDFGYRMPTAERALAAIETCRPAAPIAIETPCHIDAFEEWRRTASTSPIPIAGAELLEHPEDYAQLMAAQVPIVQPWAVRLGVTGTLEVIQRARAAQRRVMLAGWNATTVGLMAGIHLAAGLQDPAPVLEHAARALYDFPLRAIAGPEPVPRRGRFSLPERPGLGLSCDFDAIDRLRAS